MKGFYGYLWTLSILEVNFKGSRRSLKILAFFEEFPADLQYVALGAVLVVIEVLLVVLSDGFLPSKGTFWFCGYMMEAQNVLSVQSQCSFSRGN